MLLVSIYPSFPISLKKKKKTRYYMTISLTQPPHPPGLLWFGWTGFRSDIHWIAPTLSGIATGFGLLTIFLQCLNYLIDAYLVFAASAIAANTFLRSLAGAGFPLFATQMINGMGVQWAGTLLGCLAFACVPMPVWFYLRGSKIREKSRFATTFPVASAAAQDASSLSEEKVE